MRSTLLCKTIFVYYVRHVEQNPGNFAKASRPLSAGGNHSTPGANCIQVSVAKVVQRWSSVRRGLATEGI